MKNSILAVIISAFCAYSYADGNVDLSTKTKLETTVTFTSNYSIQGKITPVATMGSGIIKHDTNLATVTATTTGSDYWLIAGDETAADYNMPAFKWTVFGKNSHSPLKVYLNNQGEKDWGKFGGGDLDWRKYDNGAEVKLNVDGDQNVVADEYALNVFIAAYQS
ncbi:hypothetical protein EC835_11510 [Providencia alcalifaciens]|uniref:Saf-pilin pilus formation protein domain-containing protein n=1 Tax=Providencia alcalifaciens TaxID=126385 RepID=A0A4R3NJ55_9GAMM|nr:MULTISPECIES: hypothetical protein [Providencia]MBC5792392.1 hypothetical protein [Providencia sp. JUb39]TCT28813.1 hypothetical protein EC835_11510 [Providencia alcalifaciens]